MREFAEGPAAEPELEGWQLADFTPALACLWVPCCACGQDPHSPTGKCSYLSKALSSANFLRELTVQEGRSIMEIQRYK